MECPGFLGLGLRESSLLVATLGMLHPLLCFLPSRRFRSEFFIALYVLAGAWCVVSALLLAGILGKTVALYWLWIWFTLVYVVIMIIAMVIMIIGFYTLDMKRLAVLPALGIVYYILTVYFICVVNSQRKDVQRGRSYPAGEGAGAGAGAGHRAGVDVDALQATTPALRQATNTSKPPALRGRCGLPIRNPRNGVYMAALANNKVARPGRGYHRLRLWVYCNKFYRPRNLQYAYCYSGGWNLPLPDCVRDQSWYDEYYYNDDAPETTVKSPEGVCVPPRPPEHGYFMRESAASAPAPASASASASARHISLAVRCNPLHYLVGWQRLSCHDGVWNRPMPKCLFTDITVCTLVKRTDGMIRTCLPSAYYAGPYRCDAGLVPDGTVVEPSCPRRHYVWGPFGYMYCLRGEWHPRTVSWNNISCEHAVDIYRHFEMEGKMATTTLSDEPVRIGSLLDDDSTEPSLQSPWIEMDKFLSRNLTRMSTTKRKKKIYKTRKKLGIMDIWKAQIDDDYETVDTDFINKTIWRVHKGTSKSFSTHSTKSKLFDPQNKTTTGTNSIKKNKKEPLDDDSIITNYWKLQREALKADSITTNIWKTQTHAGESSNNRNPNIRKLRYEVADESKTNKSNTISIWASQTEDFDELSVNANNMSIWKYQSQTSWSPTTNSNEISIWKSRSENYGKRLSAPSSEISIWKTQNPLSDTLSIISTKNSIWKTQDESDKPIHPNSRKLNAKRARKKAAKWLGAHSRKTRRLQRAAGGNSNEAQ